MASPDQCSDVLLQCPLCHKEYDELKHEAKLLSCHHSICLACIGQLSRYTSKDAAETGDHRQSVKCPLCRKKTKVPEKGVTHLPTNFYISQVRDFVVPPSQGRPHAQSVSSGILTIQVPAGDTCPKHTNQPLLFFCETCQVAICMNCTVLDHDKNRGHTIKDISEMMALHKEILRSKADKAENALGQYQEHIQALKMELKLLDIAKDTAEKRLTETFSQLRRKLSERESVLRDEIQTKYTSKRQEICEHAKKVRAEGKTLRETIEKCQDLVDTEDALEVMRATADTTIMGQLHHADHISGGADTPGHIQYKYEVGLKMFADSVANLGEVTMETHLPACVTVRTQSVISCIPTAFLLEVNSSSENMIKPCPLVVQIYDRCNDLLPCTTEVTDMGTMLQFRAAMPGEHMLKLFFQGQEIDEMEVKFNVGNNDPVMKIGEEGTKEGQFSKPTSVAISPNGQYIYIADMGNQRIQVFTDKGKYKTFFKVGAGKATTYDIAINAAREELCCSKVSPTLEGPLVADSVRVFSFSGQKKRQFITKEMHRGLFLAINSKGWFILSDSSQNCIFVFSKEGKLLKKFGASGTKPGHFDFPTGVAVNSADDIYVADTRNHRVQVFRPDGVFVAEFGTFGKRKGQFNSPRGIAIDSQDNILVADSHNRIQVFDKESVFQCCIDSQGDPISEPYNMAVTNDGHVLLADYKNSCIKKYRYM